MKKKYVKLLVPVCLLLIWITTYNGNMSVPGPISLPGTETETLKSSTLPETKKVSSPGKSILLFSYMRSGSTATGYLLRDSPGVFFMFEPLSPFAPYSYFTDKSICQMRSITCRSDNVQAKIKEAIQTLIHLYSCNMKAVNMPILDKMVEENKSGRSWEEFGNCLARTKPRDQHQGNNTVITDRSGARDQYNGNNTTRSDCFEALEEACRSAEVRVAKVLRLSFTTIQTLLDRLPDLKILFLARDPRAIINSRIKTTWFPVFSGKPKTVFDNSLSLCLKMETDINAWNMNNNEYGDRILHTTLTKIASRINGFLDIFKFMDKTITSSEERNIISYLCKNLEKNITEQWRSELSVKYRRHIEEHCGYVIQHITSMDQPVDR